jgi:hypothetical protein
MEGWSNGKLDYWVLQIRNTFFFLFNPSFHHSLPTGGQA